MEKKKEGNRNRKWTEEYKHYKHVAYKGLCHGSTFPHIKNVKNAPNTPRGRYQENLHLGHLWSDTYSSTALEQYWTIISRFSLMQMRPLAFQSVTKIAWHSPFKRWTQGNKKLSKEFWLWTNINLRFILLNIICLIKLKTQI